MNIRFFAKVVFLLMVSTGIANAQCFCDVDRDYFTEFEKLLTNLIEAQDSDAAFELLDEGFDPDTKNACGYSLLLVAAEINDVGLVDELILSGADLDTANFEGVTPLFLATQHFHNDALRMLLEAGANPDVELKECLAAQFDSTPLLLAAVINNFEGIQILLEHGADFTVTSPNGANLFEILLMKDHDVNTILSLIKSVPQENRRQAKNELLFSLAMKGSKVSELREILSIPHDPNFNMDVNTPYNTPLLIAAVAGNVEGVRALIEYGADINYVTPDGYSLERLVRERSIEELYYLFPPLEIER